MFLDRHQYYNVGTLVFDIIMAKLQGLEVVLESTQSGSKAEQPFTDTIQTTLTFKENDEVEVSFEYTNDTWPEVFTNPFQDLAPFLCS